MKVKFNYLKDVQLGKLKFFKAFATCFTCNFDLVLSNLLETSDTNEDGIQSQILPKVVKELNLINNSGWVLSFFNTAHKNFNSGNQNPVRVNVWSRVERKPLDFNWSMNAVVFCGVNQPAVYVPPVIQPMDDIPGQPEPEEHYVYNIANVRLPQTIMNRAPFLDFPLKLRGGGKTWKDDLKQKKKITVLKKDGTRVILGSVDRESAINEIHEGNQRMRMKAKKKQSKKKYFRSRSVDSGDYRRTDHDRHDGGIPISRDNVLYEKVKMEGKRKKLEKEKEEDKPGEDKPKLSDPLPNPPPNRKKKLPHIYLDDDDSDDDESLPFELEPYEDWISFPYHCVETWFWFIRIKRRRTASLPLEWIEILDEEYLTAVRNSVGFTTFSYTYTKDVYYKQFRRAAKLANRMDLVALFEKNTERYFFAWEHEKSKNRLELGWGNSEFYGRRRTTNNALNKEVDATNTWIVIKYAVCSVFGLILAATAGKYGRHAVNGIRTKYSEMREFYMENYYFPPPEAHTIVDTYLLRPIQPHTLILSFPTFSLYLEEIIKCIPGGWYIVSALERLKYGNWNTYKWHKKSSRWNFKERVAQHKKKNRSILVHGNFSHDMEYHVFLHDYSLATFTEGVYQVEERMYPTAWIPWMPDDDSRKIMNRFQIAHYNCEERPITEVPDKGWFPLLWYVSPMVVPRNTYEIRWATVAGRVNKYANSVISNPLLYERFKSIMWSFRLDHIEIPDWEDQLDARQKKNLIEARKNREHDVTFRNISVQVKCDEALFAIEKMVPRLITNQSGEEFLAMGKQTSEISKWVHEVLFSKYAENPIVIDGTPYYFFFVAGATSSDLDEWQKRAMDAGKGMWTMVMGDDSYTVVHGKNDRYFLENDFSCYDRTQHRQLRKCVDYLLELSGYKELVEFREAMYDKPLKFKKEKDGKVRAEVNDLYDIPADMRYTGEAATCLDNSLINIVAFAVCHSACGEDDQVLEKLFLDLGLKSKIKRHTDVSDGTFLRGAFLRNVEGGLTWTRLPSFILKFGKVLTDPHAILKQQIPYYEKCAKVLLGQWLSYGHMRNNPSYKILDNEIRRICKGVTPVDTRLDFWQIPMDDDSFVGVEEWDRFLRNRYDLSSDQLIDCFEMLKKVEIQDLPVTWHFEVLMKLLKDY